MREVIKAAGEVSGIEIPVEVGPRREGDPAMLIASSEKIRQELDWRPQLQDLRAIIELTWNWMQEHPSGYEKQGLWAWLSRPA